MVTILNMKLKEYQVVLLVSLAFLITTLIFAFGLYMPFLTSVVKWQKELKPGHELRGYYLKLPIPLDFRVYFFNITNPVAVEEGQKPILKEIGPYCYDAFKEKIIIDENKENDTLTYSPYDTYFFNKSRSGNLSQDDYVTILNPMVVGIINAVAFQKPQYLSTINKALPVIFKESNSIYLTTKVRDVLFDGVRIDCNVKDFSATAVCSQFKKQPVMREVEKSIFLFSLLGARNGTVPQQISVNRGIKNGEMLGNVIAIDNHTDLNTWRDQECNLFRGTDGWIFPSFLKSDIDIVAPDLCRTIKARYMGRTKFYTIRAKKYYADLVDTVSPEESCYCSTPATCPPKGVMDLTNCLKVPLMCTLPHFLNADEKLLQQVEGLKPETEKHIITVYFEPTTGTPVLGQRRMQFNLQLKPLKKITIMQGVPEVLHPIFWIEEGIELDGYLLDKIITVSTLLDLMEYGRYVFIVSCIGGIAYGCYMGYQEWKLAKVRPLETASNKSTDAPPEYDRVNVENNNVQERINLVDDNLKNGHARNAF